MERVPMTPAGYQALREELDNLKSVVRPQIIDAIEEAREHGDLKENAEYHAAREKMGHVKGRMEFLESIISLAEVIDPSTLKGSDRIMFGAHVTVADESTGEETTYQLVGEHESNVEEGKISVTSPIGKALIGKEVDTVVNVKTPKGVRELEVIEVEYK